MIKLCQIPASILLLWMGFFLQSSCAAQSFEVQQIPSTQNLQADTQFGRGLSLELFNDVPHISAYSDQGRILFGSEQNNWALETVAASDLVSGIISDEYETSLGFVEGTPVVAYYDGVNGNLALASKSNGNWSSDTVDDGSGDGGDVGGFPALRITSSGSIRICYRDNANDSLKIADGTLGGLFQTSTIDANGGSWCSFIDDGNILYSAAGQVYRASYSNDSWSTTTLGIAGVQPTGGYSDDGAYHMYVTEEKDAYGNNGVSDAGLIGYYQPQGGAGNSFAGDAGAFPDFVADVGYAYRTLRYSALFGNSSWVTAMILKEDGIYQMPISIFNSCLSEIRDVDMEKASNGTIYVAFSYRRSICFGDPSYIAVQFATLAAPSPSPSPSSTSSPTPSPSTGPSVSPTESPSVSPSPKTPEDDGSSSEPSSSPSPSRSPDDGSNDEENLPPPPKDRDDAKEQLKSATDKVKELNPKGDPREQAKVAETLIQLVDQVRAVAKDLGLSKREISLLGKAKKTIKKATKTTAKATASGNKVKQKRARRAIKLALRRLRKALKAI